MLVVDELVTFEELDDTVQEKTSPELRDLSYDHFLVRRAVTEDPLLDAQHKVPPWPELVPRRRDPAPELPCARHRASA